MLDVLVALLLLALALGGACATLVQALRSTQDSLLLTRAVDFAADLADQLQHVASPGQLEAVLEESRGRMPAVLPAAGISPHQRVALVHPEESAGAMQGVLLLELGWRAPPGRDAGRLQLPVMLDPQLSREIGATPP